MPKGVAVVVAAAALSALSALAGLPAAAALGTATAAARPRAGVGGTSVVTSVSCGSPGNCAAGGLYVNPSGSKQTAFVVAERAGRLGRAILVPGLAATGSPLSQIDSVSCGSAGDCTAGGSYVDSSYFRSYAFVVSEHNGRWGKTTVFRGGTLVGDGISAVSCPAAGNCIAVGGAEGFLVSDVHGRWGKARVVPGLAALIDGGTTEYENSPATSVSCGSQGNCLVGGDYLAGADLAQSAFLVREKNGRWGEAFQVPGLAALNTGGDAVLTSLSCASAGNCAVVGSYTPSRGARSVFVVRERHGRWGKAFEVSGIAALSTGAGQVQAPWISSVSCGSAGDCVAGGSYVTRYGECDPWPPMGIGQGVCQAFLVSEKNGRWGKAFEVPGTAALNTGGFAAVTSVSCASAGNCVAGGYYGRARKGPQLAFVVREKNGRWGKAFEVPGLASLGKARYLQLSAVSCASAGNCVAGGGYNYSAPIPCPTRRPACPGFLVSEKHGTWSRLQTVRF